MDYLEQLKDLLSDSKYRIKLYDFVADMAKRAVSDVTSDQFGVQTLSDGALFIARLNMYENVVRELLPAEILIGRWGLQDQQETVSMPLRRLAAGIIPTGGNAYLIQARWYPVFLLLYAGCIGATAGSNYEMIYKLAHAPAPNQSGRTNRDVLLTAAFSAMTEIHDGFRLLPGYERKNSPRSDYLFTLLQPYFEGTLYLGSDYDELFDRAEIIMAIEYIHVDHPKSVSAEERPWGPAGRFGWQTGRRNPLGMLICEASDAGDNWLPARAGLFGSSSKRFIELAEGLSRTLSQLSGW